MMEALPYLSTIIVGVLSSVLTFLASEHSTKAKREEAKEAQVAEHKKQLDGLRTDLNARIDTLEEKQNKSMNELFDAVSQIKATCQESIAVTTVKLDALEEKQDKHNAVIERTFHLEERASVLEEKMRVANHRLEDIERHEEKRNL